MSDLEPMAQQRRSRREARLLLLLLAAAAFLAGATVPYRVDSDVAFQIKSVEQWHQGASPTPVTLSLPDPRDLSRDTFQWSNWWPPALPFLYAPLIRLGIPLAIALRITSLLLFLAGSWGWLLLAERLDLTRRGWWLYALSLALYAVTFGGAVSLRTADLPAYTAGPWLALLALRQGEREESLFRLFLGGLILGTSYWIRYALFLSTLPLLAWVALRHAGLGRPAPGARARRFLRVAAVGIGFALPVLLLFALNLRQAALVETVSGNRSLWKVGGSQTVRPPLLALSVLGAPGLGLFQSDMWINHLTYFSDAHLTWLRGLGETNRLALKALLGIPGTLAMAWALARARRRSGPLAWLAILAVGSFYLELTAVSALVGYNYLDNEPRLAVGILPLAQAILFTEVLALRARPLRLFALAALFAVPLGFAAANFAKNDLYDRYHLHYKTSATGLYMPELASRDIPALLSTVTATRSSTGDVVVLVGTDGWGGYSAFVPWLELPERTFPVGPFYAPLGHRYLDTADLRGSGAFKSRRSLRLILVLARNLVADGTLPQLEARVPQARSWTAVPTPADANVAIYFTDLVVP